MKNSKYYCFNCGIGEDSRRKVKKLSQGWFCKPCAIEKRKAKRLEARNLLIKEGQLIPRLKKPESLRPIIKEVKIRKPKISSLGNYITREEKKVLYKLFKGRGFSSESIKKRIKNICLEMGNLRKTLFKEKKSKKELNKKFKSEFDNLCKEGLKNDR